MPNGKSWQQVGAAQEICRGRAYHKARTYRQQVRLLMGTWGLSYHNTVQRLRSLCLMAEADPETAKAIVMADEQQE